MRQDPPSPGTTALATTPRTVRVSGTAISPTAKHALIVILDERGQENAEFQGALDTLRSRAFERLQAPRLPAAP